MPTPDNFFYFTILFIINISVVVFLLFNYKRTWVLWVNAIAFLIIAIRCWCEYYIQTQDSFEAMYPALVVSGFSFLVTTLIWICSWIYIRPFKGFSFEQLSNKIYIGLVLFWTLGCVYPAYHRLMFYMPPEQIDGFWKYTTLLNEWTYFYFTGQLIFGVVTALLFLLDYFRGNKWDIRKLFLALVLTYFPLVGNLSVLLANNEETYTMPNLGVFYTISVFISSWFFTGYRLFNEHVTEIVQDTFDSISDLVFLINKSYKILQINQASNNLFGEKIVGEQLDDLIGRGMIKGGVEVKQLLRSLVNGEQEQQELQLSVNGGVREFKVKVSKMRKGNRIGGFTFIMNDITDLKSTQKELSEQNYIKDRIFAVLGHDLRKPAISFQGIAKKVNYLLEKQDYKRLLGLGKSIEENAASLNKLTDNLLKWALAQRNVVPYEPASINMREAVNEVIISLKMLIDEKGLIIENSIEHDQFAYVDLNTLYTVVRNLLDNAIKYSIEGDLIRFIARTEKEKITLSIIDEGIGIPPEKISGLFEMRKGKSSKGTAGEKGTGLGLHLVHELVKLNKGHIKVESKLKQGSSFHISLPTSL